MRRFLWLWLTLLGAFWATRALVSAAVFQRADDDARSFLALAAIPTVQAAVLWWMTRERADRDKNKDSEGDPADSADDLSG